MPQAERIRFVWAFRLFPQCVYVPVKYPVVWISRSAVFGIFLLLPYEWRCPHHGEPKTGYYLCVQVVPGWPWLMIGAPPGQPVLCLVFATCAALPHCARACVTVFMFHLPTIAHTRPSAPLMVGACDTSTPNTCSACKLYNEPSMVSAILRAKIRFYSPHK